MWTAAKAPFDPAARLGIMPIGAPDQFAVDTRSRPLPIAR